MRSIHPIIGLTLLSGLSTLAYGQHYPELALGGGLTRAHLSMQREQLSNRFRTVSDLAVGGTIRVLLPLQPRWMVESQLQISNLPVGLGYREKGATYYSNSSSGLPLTGMIQAGVGLRRLELLQLGLQWTLEAALHASYAWAAPAVVHQTGQWGSPGNGQIGASWEQQPKRQGTPVTGAEVAFRYEFAERQYVLFSLNYHYGLLPLAEIHSTQISYFDANNQLRTDGRFTVPLRISYATLQVCYGWRLKSAQERPTRWRTPRYHIAPPDPTEEDNTDVNP
ncbi:hypothetical protein [Hymenobacter swuensis]|uniref:Outer membrane protein beta-barrel domain-containing protein n=1 Tax=Hymenobacter swuensis DY53 TaxID=1227739 RepID=W8FBD4_9BACT|nr:hypothetical protein [Hymenobacter swuensis]AHJ98985.1 hypothetical protein Hsw_3390 [Hymenobacter swuensis DY53]